MLVGVWYAGYPKFFFNNRMQTACFPLSKIVRCDYVTLRHTMCSGSAIWLVFDVVRLKNALWMLDRLTSPALNITKHKIKCWVKCWIVWLRLRSHYSVFILIRFCSQIRSFFLLCSHYSVFRQKRISINWCSHYFSKTHLFFSFWQRDLQGFWYWRFQIVPFLVFTLQSCVFV